MSSQKWAYLLGFPGAWHCMIKPKECERAYWTNDRKPCCERCRIAAEHKRQVRKRKRK